MAQFKQEPHVYIDSNPRLKDYYHIAYEIIKKNNFASVLDIGCASGDFLELLPFDSVKCYGVDVSEDLIDFAIRRTRKSNIEYLLTDILTEDISYIGDIDLVTIFGTALTIDNLELFMKKFFQLKPKMVMLNDAVNEYGLDVKCGYRRPGSKSPFNFAYNIRSFETWKGFIDTNYSITFEPYKMNALLMPDKDPTRNFHTVVDDEMVQRNGLDLILKQYNIYIRKVC